MNMNYDYGISNEGKLNYKSSNLIFKYSSTSNLQFKSLIYPFQSINNQIKPGVRSSFKHPWIMKHDLEIPNSITI